MVIDESFLCNLSSTKIYEEIRNTLLSLEEIATQASERTRELYLFAVRMELARDYLLDRIEYQGNQMRDLETDIKALRLSFAYKRESP